jgi:quercetin 2,3-dioxygenase
VDPSEIPAVPLPGGGTVKVIAGRAQVNGQEVPGPIERGTTDPRYLDVELPPGAAFSQAVPADYNAFLYVFEGSVSVGSGDAARTLDVGSAGILSPGDRVEVKAGPDGARLLVLAAKPLREPVVQYGPFVMNTREEIEQAIRDYQNGELAT